MAAVQGSRQNSSTSAADAYGEYQDKKSKDKAADDADAKKKAQTASNVGKGVETGGKVFKAVAGATGYSSVGNVVGEATSYAGDAADIGAGAYVVAETGDASQLVGVASSVATSTLTNSLDNTPSAFSAKGRAAAHSVDAKKALERADKLAERAGGTDNEKRKAKLTEKAGKQTSAALEADKKAKGA